MVWNIIAYSIDPGEHEMVVEGRRGGAPTEKANADRYRRLTAYREILENNGPVKFNAIPTSDIGRTESLWSSPACAILLPLSVSLVVSLRLLIHRFPVVADPVVPSVADQSIGSGHRL